MKSCPQRRTFVFSCKDIFNSSHKLEPGYITFHSFVICFFHYGYWSSYPLDKFKDKVMNSISKGNSWKILISFQGCVIEKNTNFISLIFLSWKRFENFPSTKETFNQYITYNKLVLCLINVSNYMSYNKLNDILSTFTNFSCCFLYSFISLMW